MQGDTRECSSRDEAVNLFFKSSDVYDFFENKKSVLYKRGPVIYVFEDVRVPSGVRLDRVVLTESVSDVSGMLCHFVCVSKIVRVEANSFNMSEVLETLSRLSYGHVLVDYLDDESTSSF